MTLFAAVLFLAQNPDQAPGLVWDREVVLSTSVDNKPLGRVEIFIKLMANGGARRKTISTFFAETGKTYITDEEEWDGRGVHTSLSRRTRVGVQTGLVLVSYAGSGAVLSFSTAGRGEETITYDIPAGLAEGDITRNWLLKTQPEDKAEAEAVRFDLDRMAWVKSKVTFEGRSSLVLKDQTHEAYIVKDDLGATQWLDSKGLLLKQEVADEAGLVRWERISSKVVR